jgi:hypothetical protein
MWVFWNSAPIPRWARLGLIVPVILLLGASVAYTGSCLITAQRIKDSVVLSTESAKEARPQSSPCEGVRSDNHKQ